MAPRSAQLAFGPRLMRVAIVCPYDLDIPGGVQQQCLELARRLAQGGDEAVVVGPGAHPGTVAAGRSIALPANRSRVPLTLDPRAGRLVRSASESADVVHVHEPLIPLVGWAALSRRRPVVLTFHADPAPWTRRLYRLGGGPLRRLFAGRPLTAVSQVAASALPAAWGEPELIPNGIDVASYRIDTERRPQQVAFLGRDEPRKGLDVLLGAWPLVQARFPHAELVVIGAERATSLPGVSFRGRVDDDEKRRLLASSGVFAAPNSSGESFGIVVAEAMAAGCAIVASDLPAFRPVLDGCGDMVPPGDPHALAEAMIRLLDDPDSSRAAGEGARAAAGRFDWAVVAGRYRAAYESALAAR
ncbi:MAG TPA: glycosyltransferase family 4 protein [Acidimicrobiia bacterium]|nr:glycosyltransferase family 4 protein [Acidimicrobiia bacterium]